MGTEVAREVLLHFQHKTRLIWLYNPVQRRAYHLASDVT